MGRLENVVSPIPQGASRTCNFSYPPSQIAVSGTTAIGQNLVNRQGTPWQNFFSVGSGGGGGSTTGYTHYRGRPCFRFGDTAPASAADFAFTTTNLRFAWPQTKPPANFQDDFACWQVTMLAAIANGGTETGFEIGPALQLNIQLAANDGIGFISRAANSMSIIARQGGALTIDQQIANTTLNGASFDLADWHVYTLRLIGATAASEASAKVIVDGLPVTSFNWGAGTLLPGQASGTALAYNLSVGSRAGDMYLAVCGLSLSAAATEQGLP